MSARTWTALLPAFFLTACFSHVETIPLIPPQPPSRTLILRPLSYEEPTVLEREYKQSWPTYRGLFEKGMREYVRHHGHGEWAFSTDPRTAKPGDVVLTGNINRVDQGYAGWRFWLCCGAGEAKMAGDFAVQTPSGEVLHRFHARQSYLGGTLLFDWAIGVRDILYGDLMHLDKGRIYPVTDYHMADLALRFGKTVAKQTMDWTAQHP